MGDKMIKNIIIIGLLVMIMTGVSSSEAFTHIQQGNDFLKDLLYNVERSVKKYEKLHKSDSVLVAGLLNCSSTTYNMKSEKGKVLNKVPAFGI